MSNFVQAYGSKQTGFPMLNLDHVVHLRERRGNDKEKCWDCVDADGNNLGTISDYGVPEPSRPVVPDRTGIRVVVFWGWENEVYWQTYPIIAWMIEADGRMATPIAPEDLEMYPFWVLALPSGGWLESESAIWATFDEVLNAAAERIARRDQERAKRNLPSES